MNPKRRLAIQSIAILTLLTLGSRSFWQENGAVATADAAWDALLARHVKWLPDNRPSRVNYRGFAADRQKIRGKNVAITYLDYDGSLNDLGR